MPSEGVSHICSLRDINVKMRQKRLQGFVHVEEKINKGLLSMVEETEIPGRESADEQEHKEDKYKKIGSLEIEEGLAWVKFGYREIFVINVASLPPCSLFVPS